MPDPLRELHVDADIGQARGLPGWFYTDPELFARMRERVFVPSWQLVPAAAAVREPGEVLPFQLLEGMLGEPLVVTRDAGQGLRCLSNVCTHRGHLVATERGCVEALRCRYHGRRFALDGRFLSMPEFQGVSAFPSPDDDLQAVAAASWGPLLFVSLAPDRPLDALLAPVRERLAFLPLAQGRLEPSRSRDYRLAASWALYCENYLEGFHIPYVHGALAAALDYSAYRTEVAADSVLQVGVARDGEEAFALPAGHPDQGQAIAAYYLWLFPNTMLNFYPWGISINVVTPLAVDFTRVSYAALVWDPARLDRGASADLDRVEHEDDAVVERVQQGMRARLQRRGRYSPARETGVHHFHRRLLDRLLDS